MRRLLLVVLLALAACDAKSTQAEAPPIALNINQATVEELEKLPGVGPKRARSIIASRNARGGQFVTYEEIEAIEGIGPITMNKLRVLVVLGPPSPKR